MLCPECQKEMARVGNFWVCGNHSQPIALPAEEVLTVAPAHPLVSLVDGLPTPLALPIAEYLAESSPFIALHRLADAAELITRFLAIVALSDVYSRLGDFPPSLKRELPEKLARPPFGAWRDIAAAALRALKEQRQVCFLAELPAFWRERWQPLIGRNDGDPEREILALRNNLAHAGRLPDATAATLLDQHRLRFEEALQQLSFLADYRLFATLKEGESPLLLCGLPRRDDWSLPRLAPGEYPESLQPQRVYLLKGNEALNLFPLHCYDVVMLWREEEQVFREVDRPAPMLYLRYNDRHGRQMLEFTALAPQTSFAQRGEDFRQAFLSVFNLPEWRRQREEEEERHSEWQREVAKWGYDFRDLIPDLIEGMVGREAQVEQVKKWIRTHQQTGGILWIGGKPGVGKSALMAELARRLKDDEKLCAVPFFFRSIPISSGFAPDRASHR